jgi:hypothetical protein
MYVLYLKTLPVALLNIFNNLKARQLSATAYSTYSQLSSISGGHLLYPQSKDAPCRGDNGPTLFVLISKYS